MKQNKYVEVNYYDGNVRPDSFKINKEKKTITLIHTSLNGCCCITKKVIVRCDKKDDFDWKIGLGLALSHAIDSEKFRQHRDYFRNKKTRQLDLEKYSWWVLETYFKCDLIAMKKLREIVKKANGEDFICLTRKL